MLQNSPCFTFNSQLAGLYIHIPFCLKKCSYCDFYSITDLSLQPVFLDALASEMIMTRELDKGFDTLYIGGGTPSVLNIKSIEIIIKTAYQCYNILSNAEITLEVNPGTVTLEQLKGYRKAGVNRINIGVQSFNSANLSFLERIHSARDAQMVVKWAQRAGYENIGLDLIYGIPGQTTSSWLKDLHSALEFHPQHLSCYMLSFEPGTPMHKDLQNRVFNPLPEHLVCEFFETTQSFLNANGYVQYETSNFAREVIDESGIKSAQSNISRHNVKYWNFSSYIGLGPSAHSFIEPQRFWNHSNVKKYVQELSTGRLPRAGKESLSREQLMIEAVYLGLRQTKGIVVDEFDKKFGVIFEVMHAETIADLEEKGLVKMSQNRCALTAKGMLYLDSIATMFI
ncbi:MAG: coproporphyrinogen III oxidase [Desulfobacteraceae bacterium]|nr:radical SAM family heme chaperone HemW [Desulfobacteraceae bacterium]PLX53932.1 MAG: coproporphyrinogen III oxidase [Desulfobacteraceae bacterium]